jgi:hypothetical protein
VDEQKCAVIAAVTMPAGPATFISAASILNFSSARPSLQKKNTSKNFNAPKLDYGWWRRRANCRQQVRAPSVPSASELCNPPLAPERQIAYLESLQALGLVGISYRARSPARARF